MQCTEVTTLFVAFLLHMYDQSWSHEEMSHGSRLRVILKNVGLVLSKTIKNMKDRENVTEEV